VLASVTGSVTSFVGHHGVAAVFVLMAIDAVFPAASELVMLYAGALAAGAFATRVTLFGSTLGKGFPSFLALALAGTLGYLVGAIVGWAIGRYGGRPLLDRRGRLLHLSHEKLGRAERWFERWGDAAVLVGRITPVVRSFISIPAGILEMPFWRYVVLSLVGSAIWAFAFAGAGWGLGSSYEHVHRDFRYVDYAVAALVVALLAYLVVRRRRASRSTLAARAEDPTH
jgi:membrane protein DedA with SNARE-associated domain